jgi:hypothetical protein
MQGQCLAFALEESEHSLPCLLLLLQESFFCRVLELQLCCM